MPASASTSNGHGPGPLSVELRALLRLATPVVVVQLGLMLMGLVDTIMVGHYSPSALTAIATGAIYQWGLLVFGQGILLCLDPLVSQAWGAGDREGIALAFNRGLILAAALCLPFFIAFQFAGPALRALGQSPEIVPIAAAFVRATAPSLPAFFVFVVLRQTLQGMNVVRPMIAAVVVGNLANLAGNWVLVYGHLGFPALGAVGSGWSTTLSRYIMTTTLALAAIPILDENRARTVLHPRRLRELRPYLHMLSIGVPTGIQICLEVWVFLTVALIMGVLGPAFLAGNQIAINLASLSFMVPTGIGAAAAVRVGNAVGRGDAEGARRAARVALGTGAAVMVLSALLFGLLPRLLARAFTPDPTIIEAAASLLPIAALFQIFDGTQAVGCGILRGIADTRAAAIINFIGYWILALPLGLLLAFPAKLGPPGLWWGLTAGLFVVAVLLCLRILRRFHAGVALPKDAA